MASLVVEEPPVVEESPVVTPIELNIQNITSKINTYVRLKLTPMEPEYTEEEFAVGKITEVSNEDHYSYLMIENPVYEHVLRTQEKEYSMWTSKRKIYLNEILQLEESSLEKHRLLVNKFNDPSLPNPVSSQGGRRKTNRKSRRKSRKSRRR